MARRATERVELEGVSATIMKGREDEQGRPYWRARATDRERRTLWTGYGTRAEVSVVLADLVKRGLTCSQERSAVGPVKTVGDLLRRWLKAQERRHEAGDLAEQSVNNYRYNVGYWLEVAGDMLPAVMNRAIVQDQVIDWLAAGASPRTCKLAVDVLATAWRWASDRDLVGKLDLSRLGVAVPREDEHVYADYTPSREEVADVIGVIEPGRDQNLIRLLACTGARVGEVGPLTVGSYLREEGILLISGRDRTRGRRGKVVTRRWPVQGELEELLDRLTEGRPREAPLIEDLPRNLSTLSRRLLEEGCKFCEVPRFTAHALRRLVAMDLLEQGDAKSVSLLTGHSVAVLMRDYVRPRAESLRDLVARSGVGSGTRRKVVPFGAQTRGTASKK